MSDLVGRDQELALIASFLEQVAADGGTLLFTARQETTHSHLTDDLLPA
jgi:hypothetical protein